MVLTIIRAVSVNCRSEANLKCPIKRIGREEVKIFGYERNRELYSSWRDVIRSRKVI